MKIKYAIIGASALVLAGCAGAQENAGMRSLSFEYGENGAPKSINYIDAKDEQSVNVVYRKEDSDGNKTEILYSAGTSINSTSADIRAEAEKVKAETAGDVLPDVVQPIVDALTE